MDTVIVRKLAPGATPGAGFRTRGRTRRDWIADERYDEWGQPVRDLGLAWLLDPVGLHREFNDLFSGLVEHDGLARFRERVTFIWRSTDPLVHEYIATLPTHTPDDWEAGFEEGHLAEWYRVLMGAYIRPTRGIGSPAAAKDRLPDLEWLPADARRLAWGRELAGLAEQYADAETGLAVGLVLPLGNKGWLGQDDIADFLERLRTMDPKLFKDQAHLVPLVEEIYSVLQTAASVPDRVLLLPPS